MSNYIREAGERKGCSQVIGKTARFFVCFSGRKVEIYLWEKTSHSSNSFSSFFFLFCASFVFWCIMRSLNKISFKENNWQTIVCACLFEKGSLLAPFLVISHFLLSLVSLVIVKSLPTSFKHYEKSLLHNIPCSTYRHTANYTHSTRWTNPEEVLKFITTTAANGTYGRHHNLILVKCLLTTQKVEINSKESLKLRAFSTWGSKQLMPTSLHEVNVNPPGNIKGCWIFP